MPRHMETKAVSVDQLERTMSYMYKDLYPMGQNAKILKS